MTEGRRPSAVWDSAKPRGRSGRGVEKRDLHHVSFLSDVLCSFVARTKGPDYSFVLPEPLKTVLFQRPSKGACLFLTFPGVVPKRRQLTQSLWHQLD